MDAIVAAVALLFLTTAGWAATVGASAIRTREFAPELGLELRGWPAALAGWLTLLFAAGFFVAGLLVTYVAAVE